MKKLRSAIGAIFLLACARLAMAADVPPGILKLTDGRTFENWVVIAETNYTVTIKYAKGGLKIPKALLPSDVLALYPLVEPPPTIWNAPKKAEELDPEPDGLIKTKKCERSIEAGDENLNILYVWNSQVPAAGKQISIDRVTHWKDGSSQYKIDYFFALKWADIPAVAAALDKAIAWAGTVHQNNPPSFKKSLGLVNGENWSFEWDNGAITVGTPLNDFVNLHERDLPKILLLLKAKDQMLAERIQENADAAKFADSLK